MMLIYVTLHITTNTTTAQLPNLESLKDILLKNSFVFHSSGVKLSLAY